MKELSYTPSVVLVPCSLCRLAGGATSTLKAYLARHGLSAAPEVVVDVGCSTGLSTRWLASQFPESSITGIDLSPFFLAVAEWEERSARNGRARWSGTDGSRVHTSHALDDLYWLMAAHCFSHETSLHLTVRTKSHVGKRIKYVHGMIEESGLQGSSEDMLLFQYVIHECPQRATRAFIAEAARVLKPGGTLTLVDNNPK